MANYPNEETIRRAVDAARSYLSPEDAAKIEKLAQNKEAVSALTSGLSQRDWARVMKVLNDPDLLRKVLTSSRGQAGLRNVMDQIPD